MLESIFDLSTLMGKLIIACIAVHRPDKIPLSNQITMCNVDLTFQHFQHIGEGVPQPKNTTGAGGRGDKDDKQRIGT